MVLVGGGWWILWFDGCGYNCLGVVGVGCVVDKDGVVVVSCVYVVCVVDEDLVD